MTVSIVNSSHHTGRGIVTGTRRQIIRHQVTRALHSVLVLMILVSTLPGSSCCEAGDPCQCCSSSYSSESDSSGAGCCSGQPGDYSGEHVSCCSSLLPASLVAADESGCCCEHSHQTTIQAYLETGDGWRSQVLSEYSTASEFLAAAPSRVPLLNAIPRVRQPLTALERCVLLSRLTR